MNFDAKVIGQALDDVPLGELVGNLGIAIAEAQQRLDDVAIAATLKLANEKTTMFDADGNPVTRSLLELGFAPTFYQFTEATIEVSFIASMRVSEALKIGFGFDVSGQIGNASDGERAIGDVAARRSALKEDVAEKQKALDAEEKDILTDLKKMRDDQPKEREKLNDLIGVLTRKIGDDQRDPV
ncbi:hypothetical protein [Methyloterricola oryzae]|uniref:hypothetical protein n=1 Tax=Methyloterricola oryzae TaxID=1495050 RepID=UPI00069CB14E|nr:hypothetical protein [Methyloterricola oryzae]